MHKFALYLTVDKRGIRDFLKENGYKDDVYKHDNALEVALPPQSIDDYKK